MDKKNLLITGATGYNGFKLAEYLCDKHNLTLLLRANSKNRFRIASLEDKVRVVEYTKYSEFEAIFAETKYDCILHLATTSYRGHWEDMIESNIIFPTYLIQAYVASTDKPALINTGSYFIYDSDGNYSPDSLYDASKKSFEDLLEFFRLQENLAVTTLNLYDVYGLDDWRGKIFSILLENIKAEKPLKLTEGTEILNHIYIDDISRAFEKAMESVISNAYRKENAHKHYNVASEETLSLKETVSVMEAVLGKKAKAEWGVFPYPKGRMITKPFLGGERIPGWKAEHSLRSVLEASLSKN